MARRVGKIKTVDDFTIVQGWKIVGWEVNDVPDGVIPSDLFQHKQPDEGNSTLLIGNAAAEGFCSLAWLDAGRHWWTIRGVAFDKADGTVKDQSAMVDGRRPFGALVNLWIDGDGTLNGTLNDPFGGGNSGTFTAEANPIGDEGKRKPPSGKARRVVQPKRRRGA